MKKVLLLSVFKPFGIDNKYSRKESIAELFHNQLTRYQGIFSIRATFDSYGLHAIAANIDTPTTVLDYPTLRRFKKEVAKGYDIVGIGGILPNFQKIKLMAEETRRISPGSKIVVGGFCAAAENIDRIMDIDHACIGDGISFMRDLLGKPADFKFINPDVIHTTTRVMGVPLFFNNKQPYIIAGLGCSYGCDFCAPSHFFGKRHIQFMKTGKEIFQEAERLHELHRTNNFSIIGDDNFLLHEERALELREEMLKNGSNFNFSIFASADKVDELGPEKLSEMGVNGIWIGRESSISQYSKNEGIDLKKLAQELHLYGIKTTVSSILLIDEHTKENIFDDIEEHLSMNPVFSQFSFYSPTPLTPLYDRLKEEGRLMTDIPYEEWHAFKQPWFEHPHFSPVEAEEVQRRAYTLDFERLGPGLLRYLKVDVDAYEFLKDHSNPVMRSRAERIRDDMKLHLALVGGIRNLVKTPHHKELAKSLLNRLESILGPRTLFDRIGSLGLTVFGKKEEINYKYFGDVLQPKTKLTRYNY